MLLIDGVRYELWTPPKEDELEEMVKEHAREIFGDESVYLDLKQKLKSKSGIGSIPDGYVLTPTDPPRWYIVEVELSSHPLFDHIVSQLGKFSHGIKNPVSQKEVADSIYEELTKQKESMEMIKRKVGSGEIYKWLSSLVSLPAGLLIVIEKATDELSEAVDTIKLDATVIEFQTFGQGAKASPHAHLFDTLSSRKEQSISGLGNLLCQIREEINRRRPELRAQKPTDYLFKIATGHPGIHFECLVHARQKELGVELHIERSTISESRRVLEELESRNPHLASEIGEELVPEHEWTSKWSRLYAAKEISNQNVVEWAAATMIRFYDILKPILDVMDQP